MKYPPDIRSQIEARAAFWAEMPEDIRRHRRVGWRQNDYPTDVRVAWCDWVDAAARDGRLPDALAQGVTL